VRADFRHQQQSLLELFMRAIRDSLKKKGDGFFWDDNVSPALFSMFTQLCEQALTWTEWHIDPVQVTLPLRLLKFLDETLTALAQ
jgi:hypothetical protein